MTAAGWVADIGSGRILPVFIFKHAVEHEEFFPAIMGVGAKGGAWLVADEGCRPFDGGIPQFQPMPMNACTGRGLPIGGLRRADNEAFIQGTELTCIFKLKRGGVEIHLNVYLCAMRGKSIDTVSVSYRIF